MFYRYFADKEDLLAALAESFLHDVVPSGLTGAPAGLTRRTREFFTAAVTGYWNIFKQNIGHHGRGRTAGRHPASDSPRCRTNFAGSAWTSCAASVRRAQEQGYGAELDPEHIALAIALLFENFTTVYLSARRRRTRGARSPTRTRSRTLATIWKKTLYGH